MSQVKERPILFSAPMVRAILEGRKTVTRRAVKPMPPEGYKWRGWVVDSTCSKEIGAASWGDGTGPLQRNSVYARCPYGKPGDRLWVRETTEADHDTTNSAVLSRYAADREPVLYSGSGDPEYNGSVAHWDYPRNSRPSIHMQRWASRILLEITDVRVERLQDVSEEQAQAEGCFFTDYGRKCGHTSSGWTEVGDCAAPEAHHPQRNGWMWDRTASHEQCLDSARNAFGNLWQSVGGDWQASPWVWVVEFKRVTP